MHRLLVAALLSFVARVPDAQSIRPDPGVEIDGKIVLGVRVMMRVPGSYSDPIVGVPLLAINAAGAPTAFQTDGAGQGKQQLAPGQYRVVTPTPVAYSGQRYWWDVPVTVRFGVRILELTQDNATPDEPAVVLAGAYPPPPAASTPAPAIVSALAPVSTATPVAGRFAQAKIGAPGSNAARAAGAAAFKKGTLSMDAHDWGAAEAAFREALSFDGSVAAYHAGLGALLMVSERWADAEAEYSAAMLIDVDNAEYRVRLKETRSRR